MVRALVCLGLFIAASNALFANPKRDAREAVSPVDQRQARNYATQLAELTQFIVEQYVRDLSREEVAEAALHGLYEAAGVPVPGDLHAETRRAASASEYEMRKL